MTLRIGWFTTARGPGSRGMFEAVLAALDAGTLDAEIAVVCCNRDPGEDPLTDSFFALVRERGIPLVTRSSVVFRREAGGARSHAGQPLPPWRLAYDREVNDALAGHPFELGVLAGYMLIFEHEFVSSHALLNLHPALPDGPAGTWREVIRQLIREDAEFSGVMLHLATAEVDAGPVVAYCRYPLRGPDFDHQRAEIAGCELDDEAVEASALFAAIRARGVERERPLLVATLQAFASGRLRAEGGRVIDAAGVPAAPADLTEDVERQLTTGRAGR